MLGDVAVEKKCKWLIRERVMPQLLMLQKGQTTTYWYDFEEQGGEAGIGGFGIPTRVEKTVVMTRLVNAGADAGPKQRAPVACALFDEGGERRPLSA